MKDLIDKIAFAQWLIDYWKLECNHDTVDSLDLFNDLNKINALLNEVLDTINNNEGKVNDNSNEA